MEREQVLKSEETVMPAQTEAVLLAALENEQIQTKKRSQREMLKVLDSVEKNYWRSALKSVIKDWRLYLLLLPMLLVFFFWRYLPLYELLGAFKVGSSTLGVLERDSVGLMWFADLMFGPEYAAQFWRAFRNTFVLSFYGLLFGFPIPIILAIFFNEVKNNVVRSGFQILTYLPKFVSTVVVTTLIGLLLSAEVSNGNEVVKEAGIISSLLSSIGAIPKEAAQGGLLNAPKYFRAIYQISGIWETAGYGSIVFFAAIITISPTAYEAAQMDGATKLQQFRYVVLPGMLSTIMVMLILRIGELLNIGFEKVLLLYNHNTYEVADIVSTFVARLSSLDTSGSQTNPNGQALGSAADLIAALLSMLLVIGSNRVAKKVTNTSLY